MLFVHNHPATVFPSHSASLSPLQPLICSKNDIWLVFCEMQLRKRHLTKHSQQLGWIMINTFFT